MSSPRGPLAVGITGGTGAGKTALARAIATRLGTWPVALIHQDRYYRDQSHLSPAERARVNFDEPAAFDLELLAAHVAAIRRGEAIEMPTYSFERHSREAGTTRVVPAPLALVEGLLLFRDPTLAGLFDLRVFVDGPADVRLARRLLRDVAERGRDAEGVVVQYLGSVRAMHERYVEPQRRHADLVVSNVGELEDAARVVERALRARLGLGEATAPVATRAGS